MTTTTEAPKGPIELQPYKDPFSIANEQQSAAMQHRMGAGGLSRRDHFAMAALTGLFANSANVNSLHFYVRTAVSIADGMIEELDKPKA